MSIQLLGTGVAEMGEARGSGPLCLSKGIRITVGVPQTDPHTQFVRFGNGLHTARAFRRQCQQYRIRSGDGP